MLRHPLRTGFRFGGFLLLCFVALADYFVAIWLPGLVADWRARGHWLQRWSRRFLRLLKVDVEYIGTVPERGLLVSNHLSYLDILVLSAVQPMVFVSKSEVRSWPLIGWLTRCAGTLYINRQRKADVVDLAPAFAPVVNQGVVLSLFPEGTSTGGDRVLPFLSSLLEPAVVNEWTTSPAWISYSLENGSAADEVCYWRDMTFFPHFLNLLSKRSIQGKVVYGEPVLPGLNRKQLARTLHAQVCSISRQHGSQRNELSTASVSVLGSPKTAF